ncbi:MAG TPA: antibiotic biosynthesis monooxygenase [Chloroflexota bacterium]|nr:antibiotic biosynthesis monooxygenase [Chloroflexota bacterium]
MTTTLVTQRRARAGQAAALAAAGVRLLAATSTWNPARLRLRIFQGRQRPDLLLMLSDWTSREAVRPNLEAGPVRAELDALTLGEPQHAFYHELTSYEEATAPVALATCTRIMCSRAALSPLLTYLLEVSGPTLRAQPGLVSHTLYQNEDRPTQFLSVRGYASVAAHEASHRAVAAWLNAGLEARGGRLTSFVGQTVADVTRPAVSTEPAADQSPPHDEAPQ